MPTNPFEPPKKRVGIGTMALWWLAFTAMGVGAKVASPESIHWLAVIGTPLAALLVLVFVAVRSR